MHGMAHCTVHQRTLGAVVLWSLAAGAVLWAQHTLRPGDAAEGARLYRSTCVICHGGDGRSVRGVDLGGEHFRHASSEQELVQLIRQGIRDTAMPSTRISDQEAADLVAYLHSIRSPNGGSLSGDAARGRAVFEGKGECLGCHRLNGAGVRHGPDLDGIGHIRKPPDIDRALVDPNAEVLFTFRTLRATTRRGTLIQGRVLNEDTFTIQIVDGAGRLKSLNKDDLRGYQFLNLSTMPSYRDRLTSEERSDLVAYLAGL